MNMFVKTGILVCLLAVGLAIKCKQGMFVKGTGTTVEVDCSLGEYVGKNYTKCKWFSKMNLGVNQTYHGCGTCDITDNDDCWDCATDLCNAAPPASLPRLVLYTALVLGAWLAGYQL